MTTQTTVFGIYVGNSSCCISVFKNGHVDAVTNSSGDRVTPALVGFYNNDDVVVGTAAKQGLVRHEKCTAVSGLQIVGSEDTENIIYPLNIACQLNLDAKLPKYCLQDGDKTQVVRIEEFFKHIFILLKDIANIHNNTETVPVVITIPLWATSAANSAIHSTASNTGFQVIKIISQPAAACLAYDLFESSNITMNVLIFHCGGTSIMASVGTISGGLLKIKESSYKLIGTGDAITSAVMEYLAKEFYTKYKGDPLENRRSKRKLYAATENCKRVLSTLNSAQVHVDSLWEGVDFSSPVSRARFEGLIGNLLQNFMSLVDVVLDRAEISTDTIDKVILTGGTCKISKLQNMFADKFSNAEILKKFPADEVLSNGAALEASLYISEKKKIVQSNAKLVSCLTNSIYIKILDTEKNYCLFSAGSCASSRKSLKVDIANCTCEILVYEKTSCLNGVLNGYEEGSKSSYSPSKEEILAEININCSESNSTNSNFLQIEALLKNDGNLFIKLMEPSSKISKSILIEAEKS